MTDMSNDGARGAALAEQLQAFMAARPLDDSAIDRLALQKGARSADLSPAAAPAASADLEAR